MDNNNFLSEINASSKEDISKSYPKEVYEYGYIDEDPFSERSFLSKLFYYWAYRIIKLSNLIKIKPEYLGKLKGKYRSDEYLKSIKYVWENLAYKNKKTLALIQTGFRSNIKFVFIIIIFSVVRVLMNILDINLFREYMKRFDKNYKPDNSFLSVFSQIQIGIFYLVLKLSDIFIRRRGFEYQMLLGIKTGTEFTCLIYEKILKVSPASMKDKAKTGEIINFMQVDAHRLNQLMNSTPSLITIPFQIIAYSYMLFKFFGISFIFGLITLIFFLGINFYFQRQFKKLQKTRMKLKDKRMKITTETFNNIKVLKLYSWEDEFLNRINNAREEEMANLEKRFKISNINNSVSWLSPVATSIVSIGAYQFFVEKLKIEDIFTCLGIFASIQMPLRSIPNILTNFYETSISMERIEKFLNETEINERNIIRNDKGMDIEGYSIKIENGSFTWGIEKGFDDDKEKKGRRFKGKFDLKEKIVQTKKHDLKEIELPTISSYGPINEKKTDETKYTSLIQDSITNDDSSTEIIKNEINALGNDLGLNMNNNENNKSRTILKNINFEIKKGEFICIIGEVGSGKSSLIQAILNNMLPIGESRIYVNGNISYVAQIPWIQNATVKNNIIFYQPFNEEKYNKIIDICELRPDLEILSGGDLTEIGEKGINLSGGQKARISIARALYCDRDIYLLDDPISALDANVGMKIMKNCVLKYLSGKTRILVTHALQYVSFADRIIYMKDGEINWIGSYQEIKEQNFFKVFYDKMNSNQGLKRKSSKERRDEFLNGENEEEDNKKELNKGKIKRITKDEDKEEGKVKFTVYATYISFIGGLIILFIILIFLLLMNGFNGASDIFLGYWSDHQSKSKNLYYFLIYSSLGLTGCVINYFRVRLISKSSIKGSRKMHSLMIQSLVRAPIPTFHETVPKGQIFNRLSKDLTSIDIFSLREFNEVLSCLIGFISALIICSLYQPYCLIFLPILSIVGYKISSFYVACSREMHRIEGIVRSPVINLMNETIPGAITIRAFNYQKKYQSMYHERQDENLKLRLILNGTSQWNDLYLDLLSFSFNAFLIIFTIIFKETFSVNVIGILLTYSIKLDRSLIMGLHIMTRLENSMVDIERCLKYTECPSEAPKNKIIDATLTNWPKYGKIQFINFSVKYRPDTDIVLKNISFEIKPNEKIGIAGRTGSGKSTITLCLFRILEATQGKILIDDIDISTIGLDILRSSLTIIPQDPALMEGTLRYNIDPLNKYTDNEIKEVMKRIGFDYILDKSPDGINQIITEGGSNLSVGEKQLICISRAILRKSKIIIMDEATASIDYQTEEIIQKTINELLNESTIITIAHRIKTIINYDRIMTLENGEIVNFDTPQNLLKDKNSLFYELYSKSTL